MMNQTQLRYARQRADSLYQDKIKTISAKYTTAAVRFNADEILAALKTGNFIIKEPTARGAYIGYLRDYIEFPGETRETKNIEAINKELGALKATFTALMDELILGDNEAALKMLKAFEAI